MKTNRLQIALDALVEAYMKDKLEPRTPCNCFCGTWYGKVMSPNSCDRDWWDTLVVYRVVNDLPSPSGYNHLGPYIDSREIEEVFGYTMLEIHHVELIFEREAKKLFIGERMIAGETHFKHKDLYPAVEAVFNYLISLEDDQQEARQQVSKALATMKS